MNSHHRVPVGLILISILFAILIPGIHQLRTPAPARISTSNPSHTYCDPLHPETKDTMLISNIKKPLTSNLGSLKSKGLISSTKTVIASMVDSLNSIPNTIPISISLPQIPPKAGLSGMENNLSVYNSFRESSLASDNMILNHRHIVDLQRVKNPLKTVTISSYNILSRHYLWESLYSYLPSDSTNWNKRFARLDQSFKDLSSISDIMCFQEMEYQIYVNHWKPLFDKLNYSSVFQKKPKPAYWKKSPNMMDGVSIFYNKDKFDLLNFEQVNFANHFKHSKIISQTTDTQSRLNMRNTVAVIAVLKHKFTGEVLFVSNTHLYWSPKHDDVKLMQTSLLTNLIKKSVERFYNLSSEEVSDMIRNKNGPNIISVGDFNSNPSSMVYKFMSQGLIDKDTEPTFTQNYGPNVQGVLNNALGKFKSPYKDLYSKGLFNKTTYTPKFKDIIDYIWFADCNDNFKFTKVLGDIDSNYLKDYKGFPNAEFPSDHIPIVSQIEFK